MSSATHLFTRELDLLQIEQWDYKVEDRSITTVLFTPIWEQLAKLVPRSVAPNVLTLCAAVCAMQGFWIAFKYGDEEEYHQIVCCVVAFLTFAYMTLDSIDGKHARNTLNATPLGEFFDHSLDNIIGTFQILSVFMLVGVETSDTLWYLVQCFQLLSMTVHIRAFADPERKLRFGLLTGPGEYLFVIIVLLLVVAYCGKAACWEAVKPIVLQVYRDHVEPLNIRTDTAPQPEEGDDALASWVVSSGAESAYWLCIIAVVTQVLLLGSQHFPTKFGLLLSLGMRALPAVFLFFHVTNPSVISLEVIISDGLFLSILTSDIIVAKMANRHLHSLVPVVAMASVISNLVIYAAVTLYHATVIFDICIFLNLPVLNPVINVYCDGVFDLLHLGHKKQFEKAIKAGNGTRLIVGVISDAVATDYKRRPILTEEERYASVAACKFVHRVVRDAPLVATEEFIRKHQIHIYAVGEEYVDDPDDIYYKVPRTLGMLRCTTRTPGISTSKLIKRIEERDKGDLQRAAPAKMEK